MDVVDRGETARSSLDCQGFDLGSTRNSGCVIASKFDDSGCRQGAEVVRKEHIEKELNEIGHMRAELDTDLSREKGKPLQ